jgi:hypothetical protein
MRILLVLLFLVVSGLASLAADTERSISTAKGEVGDLLRKWYAEGSAAGNVGDFYDNRDRDHSPLNKALFPQLDFVTYTDEQRKERRDWAMQVVVLKQVTFGNSSTSAAVLASGSNVRSYYAHPRGLPFLYQQYRGNNLYIYPAHHDHHPGHNGKPFYGDVFPANTPYLITSQGSSGSDQPFMRAVPATLAAFHPEVKKKLIETGLLMPTVQMIFRSSNKQLKDPKEYLTGKAHPPVFEGSWVDELKMVKAAHDMQLKKIPALVQLKVVEEDEPVPGKDMFDGPLNEKLADTPAAIARAVRGGRLVRRMVVSAEESLDVNQNPLTYKWVVLRGDRERIRIKPLNDAGSKVELLVPYHERRAVEDAPLKIESNRVDIGAFVHNGTHWSAPGFVTFFYLDNEARHYDAQGRLLERGYGFGETELTVSDWNALFDALKEEGPTLASRLLHKHFTADERAIIGKMSEEYRTAAAKLAEVRDKAKLAMEPAQKQEAQKAVDAATKAVADVLGQKRAGLELPVKELVERALHKITADPRCYQDNREAIDALQGAADAPHQARVNAARQRLLGLGIVPSDTERLTAYQKCMIERFHGELLGALVFPKFVTATFKVNFVDQRLFTAKTWRDVYRYDERGQPLGWTRFDGGEQWDFNAEGQVVLAKDEHGRPVKTRTVKYEMDDTKKNIFQSPVVLKQIWGDQVLHYEYENEGDRIGRVAKRQSVEVGN